MRGSGEGIGREGVDWEFCGKTELRKGRLDPWDVRGPVTSTLTTRSAARRVFDGSRAEWLPQRQETVPQLREQPVLDVHEGRPRRHLNHPGLLRRRLD